MLRQLSFTRNGDIEPIRQQFMIVNWFFFGQMQELFVDQFHE